MSGGGLTAVGLHKTYRRGHEQVRALRGVDLELRPGELVALLGRSGSGKTTLLNCLLGWERPDRGTVTLPGGADPADVPWSVLAAVPQRFGLLEELSLVDNVALAARLAGAADPATDGLAALTRVHLQALAERTPAEVSLGEQQRTAIARALVTRPAFLVADEPTGRLDEELTEHVLGVLREACAEARTGALVASHDPLVETRADRVLRLDDGILQPG